MTIKEIRDRISGITGGAFVTDENRFSQPFLNSLINAVRGEVVRIKFQQTKLIHPDYLQKFYPVYSKTLQDDVYCVKFLCPRVISLDDMGDGFRFIGSVEGNVNFRRIKTRGQLANYNNHHVMRIHSQGVDIHNPISMLRATSVLYDSNYGILEFYGNLDLREPMAEAVYANPFELPLYNPAKDNYPMPENDVPVMESLLRNPTESMVQKVIDLLPNSNDLAEQIKKAVYRRN